MSYPPNSTLAGDPKNCVRELYASNQQIGFAVGNVLIEDGGLFWRMQNDRPMVLICPVEIDVTSGVNVRMAQAIVAASVDAMPLVSQQYLTASQNFINDVAGYPFYPDNGQQYRNYLYKKVYDTGATQRFLTLHGIAFEMLYNTTPALPETDYDLLLLSVINAVRTNGQGRLFLPPCTIDIDKASPAGVLMQTLVTANAVGFKILEINSIG